MARLTNPLLRDLACKAWWFPPLGQGIVDFPAVFPTLNGHGF